MRRILGVIVALLSFAGCINEKIEGTDLKVGDMIPEFSVVMDDGSTVSDQSLIGNVSFIMFFHTTCPDCQQTLPVVQDIYDIYAQNGVRFAIISRDEGQEEIEPYWAEQAYNMPYSAQMSRKVYNKFASSRIPRVYICDKDGIIRYIFTDDPIPTYDDLMSSLESLIR
jgi:peroxiredoxin